MRANSILALAVLLVGIANAESPTADSVLEHVRQAWSGLKSYQFQMAKERRTLAPDSETIFRNKLLFAGDNRGKFRLEPRGSSGSTLIISSGENIWNYNESLKQFTNSVSDPPIDKAFSMAADSVPLFPYGPGVESALLSADDGVTIAGKPHPCYVVEAVFAKGPAEQGTRSARFWIDKDSYLILKRVLQVHLDHAGPSHSFSDTTTQVSVTSLEIDQPPASDLFNFDPPPGAQQVEKFDYSRARTSTMAAKPTDLVGKPGANFSLLDLDDRDVTLSSLRGKVVLLDFWATWCGPCRAEIPTIEKLSHKEKDVAVLGIDVGEDRDVVEKFVREQKLTYPILLSAQSRVTDDYVAHAYPSVVILDRNGVIRSYKRGYEKDIEKDLRADLDDARHAFRVAHAHVIWKREPEYTAEARAAGIGGLVMLSLTVSAQGAPSNIKVIRGLGHGLDEKAAEAVQRWRFEPALREGQPFAEQTQVEVAFSLTGSRGGDNAPRTAEEAFRSGARLVQAQQTEAGIAMFADAIALKPDWAAPYYARAHALYGQKKYDEAIPDFDEAIRREPDRPQWYDERGLAYSYSGRHAPAVEDDTRAIQLVPHPSASLLHHRGWAYLETGQFDKAVADLSKAIQNSPDFLKAYEHRAAAYAQLQDWPHAIADYTAAIELGPARSHYEKRAEARRAAGDAPGADEDSKKAAELFGSAK